MNEEAAVIWETVGGSKPSKRPLFQCNQAEKCCLIICLFHEWCWNKTAFCINSPSCCRSALVAARPLSALQFSVQEQTKRQRLFLLQLFLLLLLFLIIPPVCATQLYGNEAAASCLNAILKEFIDFQSEEHCAYLLQVPVALHRLRQFSLESG